MDALHGAGPVGLLQLILNHRRVRALVACVRGVVVDDLNVCVVLCVALGWRSHAPLPPPPSLPSD